MTKQRGQLIMRVTLHVQ